MTHPVDDTIVDEQEQVMDTAMAASEPAMEPVQNGTAEESPRRWHAEAGRKGAHRVHELIEAGKLYEKEHGLKRGRQRLRQLIELGKLYEQEHGLRPRRKKSRLDRMERQELLTTLLECMVRIAKPSFREDLLRLARQFRHE